MPATPAWPPKSAPRLFFPGPLAHGARLSIEGGQAHYLARVMRAVRRVQEVVRIGRLKADGRVG